MARGVPVTPDESAAMVEAYRRLGNYAAAGRETGFSLHAVKLAVARGLAAAARPPRTEVEMEDLEWTESDFVQIAETQAEWEEQAARRTGPILICDTDSLATAVWHERYRGTESEAVLRVAARLRPRALYVLTDEKDVPFVQDGLRDGEHLRTWMNDRFEAVLRNRGLPFLRIRGTREERVASVLQAIAPLWGRTLSF